MMVQFKSTPARKPEPRHVEGFVTIRRLSDDSLWLVEEQEYGDGSDMDPHEVIPPPPK